MDQQRVRRTRVEQRLAGVFQHAELRVDEVLHLAGTVADIVLAPHLENRRLCQASEELTRLTFPV